MLLKYDAEKLKSVMADFYNITGIEIVLLDSDRNVIFGTGNREHSFCHLIQGTREGKRRCFASDGKLFDMCDQARATVMHKCHAGLIDMLVPIYVSNTLFGYILFGQAGDESDTSCSFDAVYENVKDLGVDRAELERAYENLVLFDRERFDSAASIVTVLTKYMMFEQMVYAEYNDITMEISDYIEKNLSESISVSSLCRKYNMSKNMLYQVFRVNFECGVKEYIDKRRLARAELLLRTTELSVYEISLRCGIDNYQNFCRFFKRKRGVSPLQYRKNIGINYNLFAR